MTGCNCVEYHSLVDLPNTASFSYLFLSILMKLVTINPTLFGQYKKDPEFLRKAKRPCVLVVRLKYKGQHYHFAVPFRSNIPAASQKRDYFPLPPRSTTRPGNRHGLHYIKMFPVMKKQLQKYHTSGNKDATMYKKIINKNRKQIIKECQAYLDLYGRNGKTKFATDIDFLLSIMENI